MIAHVTGLSLLMATSMVYVNARGCYGSRRPRARISGASQLPLSLGSRRRKTASAVWTISTPLN